MKKIIVMSLLCSIIQACTTSTLVDPEKSKYYARKYGKIYFRGVGLIGSWSPTKMNADSKSFVVLSRDIGKDKKSIYYKAEVLDHVDYLTFRVDNGIPKDKNYIYKEYYQKLKPLQIAGVDVESFQYLTLKNVEHHRVAKDKNWYYLDNTRLNTDYETTNFIGANFFYDKTRLYTHEWGIPHIKFLQEITEPPQKLTKKYIQYKNKLFYLKIIFRQKKEAEIKEIDYQSINSLKIINDDVIAINDTIVYYGTEYPDFHAATFERLSFSGYYKDKKAVYYQTKIIQQANPKTFVMFKNHDYAKDDKHVFYEENILEGADPTSFRRGQNLEWIDDHGNRFDSKGKKIIVEEEK